MVDAEIGVTDLDQNFARLLRNIDKPVYLVANKVDNHERLYEAQDFYRLGIKGDLFCISSVSGSGTGDLLDQVVSHFQENTIEDTDHLPRITIVGRPNVGKSSTINALIGEERNIVTDIAGTTRDTLNTRYNRFGYDFLLVDTCHRRIGCVYTSDRCDTRNGSPGSQYLPSDRKKPERSSYCRQ